MSSLKTSKFAADKAETIRAETDTSRTIRAEAAVSETPGHEEGCAVSSVSIRLANTAGLSAQASKLTYVSRSRSDALKRLGILTVRDLFLHIPHRYLDFSRLCAVADAPLGFDAAILGRVDTVSQRTSRQNRRISIVEVNVTDNTGVIRAVFFRQSWVADRLKRGMAVLLLGKVEFYRGFKQMNTPFYEVVESTAGPERSRELERLCRVLPVHSVCEGISVAWMRRIVSSALKTAGDVSDWLPASLCSQHALMSWARAIREVHFPTSLDSARHARRRLAYDELFCLQLALLSRRRLECSGVQACRHVIDGVHMRSLIASLPFSLSLEQTTALEEILGDMAAPRVMNRLLLGDVGTGKTVVAALACAACADTGTQAAIMAPTSVLAAQYAQKIGPLLDAAGITNVLIQGATPAAQRRYIEQNVASGAVCVVFGTTAILSSGLMFSRLSLVIIDEQHRFGVHQRAALRAKGPGADHLSMTATPIPRTLARSLYGDLDISRIIHRPLKGAGVETRLLSSRNLDLAWGAVRDAASKGHASYVICPLIDEKDAGNTLDDVPETLCVGSGKLHAAVSLQQELSRDVFPECSVGLLTGAMKAADKDRVMSAFSDGELDVLVATTVVEVGVDVSRATVMVILDADRFGLATLHQLRGRVGRGHDAGVVYLISDAKAGSVARRRMDALVATSDGAELAELDLKLRHEGEILGYKQHGEVSLRIADLYGDRDLVDSAHRDARDLLLRDPKLELPEHGPLEHELRVRFGSLFEELER